jgi:hypothetical protein
MPFDDDAQVRTRIEMADEEALSLQLPPVDDRVIGKRMALGRRAVPTTAPIEPRTSHLSASQG